MNFENDNEINQDIVFEGRVKKYLSNMDWDQNINGRYDEKIYPGIDYDAVNEELKDLHDIWLESYQEEYKSEGGKEYTSPFEMLDEVAKKNEDFKLAANVFESSLLRSSVGYMYAKDLMHRDPQRYQRVLERNAGDEYWAEDPGSSLLSSYSMNEEKAGENYITADLVGHMINEYMYYKYFDNGKNEYVPERMEILKGTVDSYLLKHAYSHLEYWKKDKNIVKLIKYEQQGGISAAEVLDDTHKSYKDVLELGGKIESPYSHRPKINEEEYNEFRGTWEILKLPGILEGGYQKFRDQVVNRINNPSDFELFKQYFSKKEKKYPFVNFIDKVARLRDSEEETVSLVAKKFLSNLLFDPELTFIVNSLRMFENSEEELEKARKQEAKEAGLRRYRLEDTIIEKTRIMKDKALTPSQREQQLKRLKSREKREEKIQENIKSEETSITYDELLELAFNNPDTFEREKAGAERWKVLMQMYVDAPYVYMDVVSKYLEAYVTREDLSEKEMSVARRMLFQFFSVDYKGVNRLTYDRYSEREDEMDNRKIIDKIKLWGTLEHDLRIKENIAFFIDTQGWIQYFLNQKDRNYELLSSLCEKDQSLFLQVMSNFIENANTDKEKNYFDSVRTLNLFYQRMEGIKKQELNGEKTRTVDDPILSDREETERSIIENVQEACNSPVVKVSINEKYRDEENRIELLQEYLNRYSTLVSKLEIQGSTFVYIDNGIQINGKEIENNKELLLALKALGFEMEEQKNTLNLKYPQYSDYLEKIVGTLLTPTLYEWRVDDLENKNKKNGKSRSGFFFPGGLDIEYTANISEHQIYNFNPIQQQHFSLNYLPWYVRARILSGDIESLDTVVSTWLNGNQEYKNDVRDIKSDILDSLNRIWPYTVDSLKIAYDSERFARNSLLNDFLENTCIEQIVSMIDGDRRKSATIAGTIFCTILERGRDMSAREGIRKTVNTVGKQFEGYVPDTRQKFHKIQAIKKRLERLGFSETEEGLEKYRNLWENLKYLRFGRGLGQAIIVTPEGLRISNPYNSMYKKKKVQETSKGESIEKWVREYNGGPDSEMLTWKQIAEVVEMEIDLVPLVDLTLDIANTFTSIFRTKRVDFIRDLEKHGAGNMKFKLSGREEPLCEFFAVSNPYEFRKELKNLATTMLSEEGAKNTMDLLKILNNFNY